jgi:hypothetical protein
MGAFRGAGSSSVLLVTIIEPDCLICAGLVGSTSLVRPSADRNQFARRPGFAILHHRQYRMCDPDRRRTQTHRVHAHRELVCSRVGLRDCRLQASIVRVGSRHRIPRISRSGTTAWLRISSGVVMRGLALGAVSGSRGAGPTAGPNRTFRPQLGTYDELTDNH